MSPAYPKRPPAHQLEDISRTYFANCLPAGWTHERPEHDYGVDVRVDIFEDDRATGLEMLVQLKASEKAIKRGNESLRLFTTTYNMLRDKLQVVMLVKYSKEENEAYWLWLRDAPEPAPDSKSLTVSISKANRLSTIDWQAVQTHVRRVTDVKLAAMRRAALFAANNR